MAQEFEKIIALHSYAPSGPRMSFARLGLSRTDALQGDPQNSRTAYQDLLALWKDAKAEYAKLQ